MQLKIYVSSTFVDLEQHRERVYRALRALRHDVIAMEDYVAADERPLDRCLRDVHDADIYVGIFAWRYGYVPIKGNRERRSITELEYLEAGRLGKPRLTFVLDEKAPWPPSMMDSTTGDNERGARIQRLRQAVQRERLASRFESAEQLANKVVSALYLWQLEPDEALVKANGRRTAAAKVAASQAPGGPARARAPGSVLWAPGSRLRVRFLDGSELLQQRVLRLAQIWSAYANIGLELSEEPDAEVRVAFKEGDGSWAYEGTQCLAVPLDQPTVNLDWLKADSPISDMESVVVHEFGHVLGLAHEHSNPDAGIKWNKAVVYEQMCGPPNHWDRTTVNRNFFTTWPRDRFPLRKPFDPLSISAFPIPAEWMKNGVEIGRNTTISTGDREFISRLYPYNATGRTRAAVEPQPALASKRNRGKAGATATRG